MRTANIRYAQSRLDSGAFDEAIAEFNRFHPFLSRQTAGSPAPGFRRAWPTSAPAGIGGSGHFQPANRLILADSPLDTAKPISCSAAAMHARV
jgi:hypothetical protein